VLHYHFSDSHSCNTLMIVGYISLVKSLKATWCKLRSLIAGPLLLGVLAEDLETVAMGFKAVFSHLIDLMACPGGRWRELGLKIRG